VSIEVQDYEDKKDDNDVDEETFAENLFDYIENMQKGYNLLVFCISVLKMDSKEKIGDIMS